MRPERPAVDVSQLPTTAFGSRDPLWWGIVLLMCIEGTVFVLTLVAYFYIRGNLDLFPPTAMPRQAWWVATLNAAVLLLSALPLWWSARGAHTNSLSAMRWGLLLGALLNVAFLAGRVWILLHLPFRWDSHAYGSVFWTLLGLHTVHVIAGTVEDLVLIKPLVFGPLEEKHLVDVDTNAFYWYFVIASWLPIYAVLYLDPALLRTI